MSKVPQSDDKHVKLVDVCVRVGVVMLPLIELSTYEDKAILYVD